MKSASDRGVAEGGLAKLVRELEMDADIAGFIYLDMVYQVREDFTGQRFNTLILCGYLVVEAVGLTFFSGAELIRTISFE